MAKVTGPLGSFTASGTIAKAHVHFQWHGIAVVRKWFKPAQMNSDKQGNVRQILAGLGASCKPVQKLSLYAIDAKGVAMSPNTYVSQYVQYMQNAYMKTVEDYEAKYSQYMGATGKTAFDASATAVGLQDIAISYAGTEDVFKAGFQLYLLAQYGIDMLGSDNTKFNRAPYTTALASWTGTQTALLVSDLLPVVP